MKRIFRLCACLLVAAVLCVSLCGCDALDEARANHGFWTESGTIQLGESEYLLLPYCDELQPVSTRWTYVNITEPDVPVLMSFFLGSSFLKSDDGLFLDDGQVYCRADRYEEIRQRIENGVELTGYCYEYSVYNEEDDEYVSNYYTLSATEVAAVNNVLATVEATALPLSSELYYDYSAMLEFCSEDLLFRRIAFDICYMDNAYYIVDYAFYDRVETGSEETLLYKVPAAYESTFHSIMATLVESENYVGIAPEFTLVL